MAENKPTICYIEFSYRTEKEKGVSRSQALWLLFTQAATA